MCLRKYYQVLPSANEFYIVLQGPSKLKKSPPVVVAQLAEWPLPTPEVCGSNPIRDIQKTKIKKKGVGSVQSLKKLK